MILFSFFGLKPPESLNGKAEVLKNRETRLQVLMVKDLARNKRGNKAETDPLQVESANYEL